MFCKCHDVVSSLMRRCINVMCPFGSVMKIRNRSINNKEYQFMLGLYVLCNIQKFSEHWSRNVRKRTFWNARRTKTQISLNIRAVWSESSLPVCINFASLVIQNAECACRSGPEAIRHFLCSTQLSMNFHLVIKIPKFKTFFMLN